MSNYLKAEQDLRRMLEDHADDNGVILGKIGAHFGEQQRVAGLSYANLLTQMRIADALERIADTLESGDTAKGGAQG